MRKNVMEKTRQRAFASGVIEAIAERQTDRKVIVQQVGEAVGYGRETSKAQIDRIFSTSGVRQAFIDMGYDPSKMLSAGADALGAKKGAFFRGEYTEVEAPDHSVRLQGANFLADVLGMKKQVIENQNVNVNIDAKDIENLFG